MSVGLNWLRTVFSVEFAISGVELSDHATGDLVTVSLVLCIAAT
jgi:hypothetical protein